MHVGTPNALQCMLSWHRATPLVGSAMDAVRSTSRVSQSPATAFEPVEGR